MSSPYFVLCSHFLRSEGISSNASGSLIIKPCTQAEVSFYESAKDHPLFQAHMPTFIGSLSEHEDQDSVAPLLQSTYGVTGVPASIEGTSALGKGAAVTDPTRGLMKRASWKPSGGKKLSTGLAIVLENVASGFKRPNVLDVKLGARLWDDAAPESKRRKLDEVAAESTSGSLGMRIAGMKVWLGEGEQMNGGGNEESVEAKDGYKSYDKFYGRKFNKENVSDAFTTYLGGVDRDVSTGKVQFKRKRGQLVAKRLLRELESIQYVLENEESRMYSASVLIVYEGDEDALEVALNEEEKPHDEDAENLDEDDEADEDDDEEVIRQRVHEVRLIDFAHANWTPGQGPDENMLQGIRSLVKIFRELIDRF